MFLFFSGSRLVVLKRSLAFSLLVEPTKWGAAAAGSVAQAGTEPSPLKFSRVLSGRGAGTCEIVISDEDVQTVRALRVSVLGLDDAAHCVPNYYSLAVPTTSTGTGAMEVLASDVGTTVPYSADCLLILYRLPGIGRSGTCTLVQ
jgi:hypothetical protein